MKRVKKIVLATLASGALLGGGWMVTRGDLVTEVLDGDSFKIASRVLVKLTTKDLVGDEILYKNFEGYWDVKNVNGHLRLWQPSIKEVTDPDYAWYYD